MDEWGVKKLTIIYHVRWMRENFIPRWEETILGSIFGSILGLILGFKYYVKYCFEGRFPGSRRQWKWHMRGQKFEWNCIKGILISFILNSSVITKNPSFWIYKILYCKERNFFDPYFAFDNCGSWTLWTWGPQLWIHPGS